VVERSHHSRRHLFGGLRKADHSSPTATDHRGVTAVEATGAIADLDPPHVEGGHKVTNEWIP
jgi:hypothetical protein